MIRPARGVVLVRKATTEETLPGGRVIIPQDSREKLASYQVGVVAVGAPGVCENEVCARNHHTPKKDEFYWDGTLTWDGTPVDARMHIPDIRLTEGAWAIVRPRSFIEAGSETGLYFVRQDDILGVFIRSP